jgi:hypothetical protein
MARTAVADRAVAASFDAHQITEELASAVTIVPAAGVRAGDAADMRQSKPMAHAASEWEYLAEGYAWVLDACD